MKGKDGRNIFHGIDNVAAVGKLILL